jgi:hypothetical protein
MLDYLATCSKTSLESFELARLNDLANLRKHMIEIVNEWVEADIQARIAEWVLLHRRQQAAARRRLNACVAPALRAATIRPCRSFRPRTIPLSNFPPSPRMPFCPRSATPSWTSPRAPSAAPTRPS